SWAILLEDPPPRMPANVSTQVLIGWWWIFCLIVTITYRSSLVAHLTVPGMSLPLDSFEDLIQAKWSWGMEPNYGSGWEWLSSNENPTAKQIFKGLQIRELSEQMQRVQEGSYAFLSWKYYIRSIIANQYTNDRGYQPFYTAQNEYFNYGGYAWSYRKGAPFLRRFDEMTLRLVESGAITHWMDRLI
ncbi:unnamed protein product, partial [Meganyctiphanes norvegica]